MYLFEYLLYIQSCTPSLLQEGEPVPRSFSGAGGTKGVGTCKSEIPGCQSKIETPAARIPIITIRYIPRKASDIIIRINCIRNDLVCLSMA